MKLYHGSYFPVEKPDISFSRDKVDFGKGFYTTPLWEQAESWAKRFRRTHGQSVISTYEVNMKALQGEAMILTFEEYSDEWLDFIYNSRNGRNVRGYDIVIGGVANDRVFNALSLYEAGWIDKAEAIKRLRYEDPSIQYCFRNQDIIDKYLLFVEGEVVK